MSFLYTYYLISHKLNKYFSRSRTRHASALALSPARRIFKFKGNWEFDDTWASEEMMYGSLETVVSFSLYFISCAILDGLSAQNMTYRRSKFENTCQASRKSALKYLYFDHFWHVHFRNASKTSVRQQQHASFYFLCFLPILVQRIGTSIVLQAF